LHIQTHTYVHLPNERLTMRFSALVYLCVRGVNMCACWQAAIERQTQCEYNLRVGLKFNFLIAGLCHATAMHSTAASFL